MRKKRASNVGILVAILLLAVGFAAVTTTLYINGTARIVPDDENFKGNVIFDADSTYTNATNGTVTLSTDKRTITFTSNVLTNIGDTAILNYRIKNESQYDAQLGNPAVVCTTVSTYGTDTTEQVTATADDHITIAAANNLDGVKIDASTGTSDQSSITVSMVKSYIGDQNDAGQDYKTIKFQCTIAATAVEAN